MRVLPFLIVACGVTLTSVAARADADANQCGAWMEQFQLAPYRSWGSTPGPVQRIWDKSDCNHKVCQYMADKYGVVPNKSWGSLPGHLQKVWDTPEVDCNHHVTLAAAPAVAPATKIEGLRCAAEHERCEFKGKGTVSYGAQSQWVSRTFENGVDCNNDVFGDPAVGVVKECRVLLQSPQGDKCAKEHERCTFSGSGIVFYGARDHWVARTYENGVDCNNDVFGDPVVGAMKECRVVVAAPPQAAKEAVDAGPLWGQADADKKCPSVCGVRHWTGQWWTKKKGRMSVCECETLAAAPMPPPVPMPMPRPVMVQPPPAPPPPQPVMEEPRPVQVAQPASAMVDSDFQEIVQAVKAESFSENKQNALKMAAEGKYFSIDQVGKLVDLFSFSSDKLQAVRTVKGQIIDPQNKFKLLGHFTFSSDKEELQKILK